MEQNLEQRVEEPNVQALHEEIRDNYDWITLVGRDPLTNKLRYLNKDGREIEESAIVANIEIFAKDEKFETGEFLRLNNFYMYFLPEDNLFSRYNTENGKKVLEQIGKENPKLLSKLRGFGKKISTPDIDERTDLLRQMYPCLLQAYVYLREKGFPRAALGNA